MDMRQSRMELKASPDEQIDRQTDRHAQEQHMGMDRATTAFTVDDFPAYCRFFYIYIYVSAHAKI